MSNALLNQAFLATAGAIIFVASAGMAAQQGVAKGQDSALITAAERGEAEAVKRLLAQGASIGFADESGVTALIAAAYHNHVDVSRLLISAGADVNAQDKTRQSAFLIATSEGYLRDSVDTPK